jgi:xylulose-5-phosphate/fructose-6-phosphate phosphoketolase
MIILPDRVDNPGQERHSAAEMLGACLRDEMERSKDFYLFSPDETSSNRLDEVFEVTGRAWVREVLPWDKNLVADGRVVELLSENALFAVMAGHIFSGGKAAMTSYEAFFSIVGSQVNQHLKFLKQSKEISWRPEYNALNLLSTSCWQRQDHNGYTHQSPALISEVLAKPSNLVNCLFPVDDVAAVAAWEFMQDARNVVNLTTFNKTKEPRWVDINHARFQLKNGGASVFEFASDPDPEVVMVGVGDISSKELLYARQIVKLEMPGARIKFVGVGALSYGAIGTTENKLSQEKFDEYFTKDKQILVNFHGYAADMWGILTRYADVGRLEVHGYKDEGSTTTPLDMLMRNGCDRYSLAMAVFQQYGRDDLVEKYQKVMAEAAAHAELYGEDEII